MPRVSAHPTPNPDSLKLTVEGVRFLPSGLRSFRSAAEAEGDALGSALLAVPGVANVFYVPDFLTVTKAPSAHWDDVYPAVERVVSEHASRAQGTE